MATATLCEKTDYRLSALPLSSSSSSGSQSANQSLFLVKLTDSSERALEKFLANQKRISRRPMIHFESAAGGSISIPSSEPRRGNNNNNNKDDDEDDDDVFYFSIGQEASGCVDITAEAGRGQLRPVGSAKQKLTIHATSETFSQTREKMAQLEDANKQQQAKEIKPGLKGKRGKQMVASSMSSSSKSASSSGSKTSFVAAAAAKALPSSSSLSSSSRSSPSLPEVGVRVKTKPEPTRTKQPTPPPSSSSFRSQDTAASTNLNTSSSSSSSNLTSTAPPPSSSSLTPLTGRPLHDRILHLLALKPYKKAELVLRLRVDGFTTRKEEPEALADLLNSIGYTPKSKPSSFMLKKELYKEVDPHWEFYTDDERKQLSKQLAHYSSDASSKRVDGSDGGKASSSADDKTSASAKRPASLSPSNDSATSAPNYSKKAKRIAHRPKGAGGPGDGVAGGSTPPPPSTTPQQSPSENRSVSPVTPPTSNGVTSADNSG